MPNRQLAQAPERQRNLLEGLARSERQLTRSAATAPISWPALIETSLRVIPTALALAGGFATLAFGHGGRQAGKQALAEEAYLEALGRSAGG